MGGREGRVGRSSMFLNLYIWNTWSMYNLNKILKRISHKNNFYFHMSLHMPVRYLSALSYLSHHKQSINEKKKRKTGRHKVNHLFIFTSTGHMFILFCMFTWEIAGHISGMRETMLLLSLEMTISHVAFLFPLSLYTSRILDIVHTIMHFYSFTFF